MPDAFTDFRLAARQVLTVVQLSEREGQFLGGLCYRTLPLTEKQSKWLRILLERHGFPTLVAGGTDV